MASLAGALFYFFPTQAYLGDKVRAVYPEAAIEFMQRQQIQGRIFNDYGWGGYMEWTAPDLKPFIDGRADIFVYNRTFDEYDEVAAAKRPLEILNKYRFDYVLFNPDTPLGYLLDHSKEWRSMYSDKTAVLYQHVPAVAISSNGSQPASN
jgi:hypothetical protein